MLEMTLGHWPGLILHSYQRVVLHCTPKLNYTLLFRHCGDGGIFVHWAGWAVIVPVVQDKSVWWVIKKYYSRL